MFHLVSANLAHFGCALTPLSSSMVTIWSQLMLTANHSTELEDIFIVLLKVMNKLPPAFMSGGGGRMAFICFL